MTFTPLICEKNGKRMPMIRASRMPRWNNCRIDPLSWAMVSSISVSSRRAASGPLTRVRMSKAAAEILVY